jgi:hypothetical protein
LVPVGELKAKVLPRILIMLVLTGILIFFYAVSFRPLIRYEVIKHRRFDNPSIIPTQNWKYFSSKDGQFSALFPGVPINNNVLTTISGKNMNLQLSYVETDIDDWFGIGFVDNPIFAKKEIVQNPQQFLEKAQMVTISNETGRVAFKKEMKSDGYPAIEFEYAAGGNANYSVHYKLILVGSRMYEIYVVFLTATPP